ncbi:MAG: hypothetical protein JXR31_02690 [Prolixibacteraceae bacterium]|nr:hypothetical protein [Prolixibacteraceae bacterium]MBN2773129.1 hypothetical protein [Prolixibacteraceae bacterium]
MNKFKIKPSKKIRQILTIVLLFIIVSFSYFPACLENKVLDASDYNTFSGTSKELKDFKESTGNEALWTNSLFGGMPAYLILTNYEGNIFQPYFNLLSKIPKPVNYIIVNFCVFFLMALIFGANPWISFAGALAYGFSTFTFIFLAEGHITKMQSVSYFPMLIAGIYLAFNKNKLTGGLLTAIGLTLILSVNHAQMTYYAAFMAFIMGITYFIYAIKENVIADFFKSAGILLAAVVFATGISFGPILNTYKYSKYSTRGKTNVPIKNYDQPAGLNSDYILDFSYDPGEAVTAFIPRFRGGSITEPLDENSETFRIMEADQGKGQAVKLIKSSPVYWGCQPMSRGPFYFGAVLCYLFVFGLFIVKGKEKWWIVSVVVISFLLSFGKNIPFLADFMIKYFPGYNKFRAVTNIVVIQHFAMALMGVLAVKEIFQQKIDPKKLIKALKISFAIVGGFALLFAILPALGGSFRTDADIELIDAGWPQQYIEALVSDRKSILRADAFRSFVFVSLAVAGIWAFAVKKLKAVYALGLWIILIVTDLWIVDKKYLNNNSFVSRKRAEVTFPPTEADKFILKDKDPNYRVLNLSLEPFTDASTSYYHKSVGGNNGAKLRRYHEMIYYNISREIQDIIEQLEGIKTEAELDTLLSSLNSINMLNTRYIIFNPDVQPIINRFALGNAWFAGNYRLKDSAEEEVRSIKDLKITQEAVVSSEYKKYLSGKTFTKDDQALIKLESYAPNKLVYHSESKSEQLAVFSEIYYPEGWIAKIDNVEASCFRANYIFRSMIIPAGSHEIVFEFNPQSYKTGNAVSLTSSVLLIIAVIGVVLFEIKKKKKTGLKKLSDK